MVPTVSYFGSFFTSLDVWCVHRLYSSHQERRASSVLHSHRFIFVFFFFSFCSTSCRCFGVGRESRREFARQANDTVVRAGSIVHVQRRVSYYGSHQLVVRVGWNLLHVDIICGGGRCTGGWCLDSNSNSTVITMGRPCLDPGTQKPTIARAWRIIDPVEEEFSVWVSKDWRNSLGRTAERTKPTNPGHQGCESLSTLGNKGIRSFGREDQDHGRAAEDDPHHPVRTNGDT